MPGRARIRVISQPDALTDLLKCIDSPHARGESKKTPKERQDEYPRPVVKTMGRMDSSSSIRGTRSGRDGQAFFEQLGFTPIARDIDRRMSPFTARAVSIHPER